MASGRISNPYLIGENMKYLVILAVLMLAGCSTMPMPGSHSWSYNPANYQGCVQTVYEEENRMVTHTDCKDKDTVAVMVDMNSDGAPDMTYDASDVVGSDAAKIRADVEKVFAEKGAEVAPDVVDGVVDAILGL